MKNEKITNEIEDQEFKWGEKRELTDVERMEYYFGSEQLDKDIKQEKEDGTSKRL